MKDDLDLASVVRAEVLINTSGCERRDTTYLCCNYGIRYEQWIDDPQID